MPTCYLAEPIDGATLEDKGELGIIVLLEGRGITVFRPKTAWHNGLAHPNHVDGMNREMLLNSDFLLARMSGYSIGVPMEIEYAHHHGIPTIVIVDPDAPPSLMLAAKRSRTFWVVYAGRGLREQLRGFLAALPDFPRRTPAAEHAAWLDYTVRYIGPKPTRAYAADVGHDLAAVKDWVVEPHAYSDISCGLFLELPPNLFGWVVGRSSTFNRTRLVVLPGVVDAGYRGEMKTLVWNTSDEAVLVKQGERLGQLLLLPNLADQIDWVPSSVIDDTSERGESGYGSSGV